MRIILQNTTRGKSVPTRKQFSLWVNAALPPSKKQYELVIRVVGNKESAKLNKLYRHKNCPTNILSFPFAPPPKTHVKFLGDLVICIPLVKKEAKVQGKTLDAHFAHLTIHGVLHLLGYTHNTQTAAQKMETLEVRYLKKLGLGNPYK